MSLIGSESDEKIEEAQRHCDTSYALRKPFVDEDLKLLLAKIDLSWPLVLGEMGGDS